MLDGRMCSFEIEELRNRLGLSRRELAAEIGVSKKAVESWELGARKPSGPANKMLQEFSDGTRRPFLLRGKVTTHASRARIHA
jgi:DNA-binding XRE family transcriptional regulator